MKVRITFDEPLLGTLAGDPEIATEHILSKHPDLEVAEDEKKALEEIYLNRAKALRAEALKEKDPDTKERLIDLAEQDEILHKKLLVNPEEVLQKSSTIFARTEDGTPMLWDYMLKGFFKDACSMLRRVKDTRSSKLTAHKKIIDGLIFVKPRKIPITVVGKITILERPLRAETAQGPRIALARSESIPAGSSIEIEITPLDKKYEKLIIEWLDYGQLRGLGQWRNASYGRFSYEKL